MKVFRLHMGLTWRQPNTWRLLDVREDTTCQQLHEAIQLLFGWEDKHPWALGIEEESVGTGRFDKFQPEATIGELLRKQRFDACYQYDLPDYWEAWVQIQQITLIKDAPLFKLIDGAGNKPGEMENGTFWPKPYEAKAIKQQLADKFGKPNT